MTRIGEKTGAGLALNPDAPASLSHEAEGLSSEVFSSFAETPPAWQSLCVRTDLAMDPQVLSVFQRTLADQCRCWGVIVTDHGAAIGCAALCLFPTELMDLSSPMLARLRDRIRRLWPSFMRMKVLFCGLPTPSGSTHFRARSGADVSRVAAEVDRVMRRIGRTVGARLLVFKELEETSGALPEALRRAGYMHGGIPPMHLLNRSFKNFADYRDALKSRYRAQIQRSEKKLTAAGFEALCGRGAGFFDVQERYPAEWMWHASRPMKAAIFCSSSRWYVRDPFEGRAPVVLVPHFRSAARPASITFG